MEENDKVNIPLELDAREIAILDSFRKKKDTSVLTIMLTDIKNFTRLNEEKGDEYSNKVRKFHDELLTKIIEENESGKVLKKIGDSVMAIFAEPSTAVEKALLIQEKLREFNKTSGAEEKIEVRIGLNMGQMTVENNVNTDVFGRVVNRAARIKEMADGGHIFLSFTVFDSAKGAIASRQGKNYEWKLHGQYFVKGVDEALAVYEVFDKDNIRPKAPVKGKKKSSIPKLIVSLALIFVSAAFLFLAWALQYKSTTVVFRNVNLNTKLLMDDKKEITLDGERNQELRTSLTKIRSGKHVIYYDVSYVTRYYAEMNIKRGKNIIEPRFEYNGMPGVERAFSYSKGDKNVFEVSETQKYLIYDKEGKKKEASVLIHFMIQGKQDPKIKDKVIFDCDLDVTLDGKVIAKNHITDDNTGTEEEIKRAKSVVYEDDFHYYYTSYYISRSTMNLTVGAAYIEYK